MLPHNEPEPEQASKSTRTSPELSSRWGQITTVKIAEEKAEIFQRDRLLVEEQARQRGELLENAVQESKVARKENRILMAKIASLQAGVETFSDEQVKREMCLLYRGLEHWRFTHFVTKPAPHDPKPRSDSLDISTLDIIQADIAGLIYRSFWNQFMVGSDHFWSNYLRKVDSEINKKFSNHISRHWRCAMSSAILSLETPSLEGQCNWIIEQVESCFGRYAVADKPKRMQQLHEVIARCIKFKHKLDCQEDRYIFWGSYQYGLPFRDDKMRTLTEDTSDGFVQTSLWPGLYKIVQTGEWSTVEKEIVKKIAPETPSVEMIDEMESHECDPDLDEI
ncbi:unnamed protein product [Penicillium egyptiacum]|uniref:Uncharacterized protein n=1 Tax=Penicillium egyptiacum TaxID=1303716 RepID=A0A9W4K6E9_9EURO|nr:unnamed protein product [Penicillium egyptiacum]